MKIAVVTSRDGHDLVPYTSSAVAVWLCPASSAIASTGTPRADSSEVEMNPPDIAGVVRVAASHDIEFVM